jgi:hypothetical protein
MLKISGHELVINFQVQIILESSGQELVINFQVGIIYKVLGHLLENKLDILHQKQVKL